MLSKSTTVGLAGIASVAILAIGIIFLPVHLASAITPNVIHIQVTCNGSVVFDQKSLSQVTVYWNERDESFQVAIGLGAYEFPRTCSIAFLPY